MATLRTYKCKECGYEVQTEPRGHYSLMSGEYYNFSCHKCKEIVTLSADDLSTMRYFPRCPECGEDRELWTLPKVQCSDGRSYRMYNNGRLIWKGRTFTQKKNDIG